MKGPLSPPPANLGRGSLVGESGVLSLEATETSVTPEKGPGDPEKIEARRMKDVVQRVSNLYQQFQATDDARNLDYYAGKQWSQPAVTFPTQQAPEQYNALQNEMFPVIDAMTSALAMELPQVSFEDQRITSVATPDRATDGALAGRRIAAVYNNWAQIDDLDETLAMAVRCSLIFDKGGIIKTSWDTTLGRPIWEALNPDEVFFDPLARKHNQVGWVFQLFHLHWDEFKSRCDSEMYKVPPELAPTLRPEAAPVSLKDKLTEEPQEQAQRSLVKEYIAMVEWYDCRKGKCYHLLRESGTIVATFDTPLKNPFRRLIPNPIPGKPDGISVVSLCAPNQRTINELVAAREQVVRRMAKRLMIDGSIFKNDKQREEFKNSKSWDPVFLDGVNPDRPLDRHFFVTPEMPLGFDFNAHLSQTVEALRYTAGAAAYMQGRAENIRTAEEATMIRGATQGRLQVMSSKVVKFASQLFQDARAYMQWALENPDHSHINVRDIWLATQTDMPVEEFEQELRTDTRMFALTAFNPLMRDENTRRTTLNNLLPTIMGSPLLSAFNVWELARELCDLYGVRLSTLIPADEFKKLQEAATAQAPGAPGAAPPGEGPPGEAPAEAPPGGPPEGGPAEGGIPPEILQALMSQSQGQSPGQAPA